MINMSLFDIIKLIIFIFLIGGNVIITIISSSISCLFYKLDCDNLLKLIASSIISPQKKISNSIQNLKKSEELNGLSKEYKIEYVKTQFIDIVLGSLLTLFYIMYIIEFTWKIFPSPGFKDIGVKILVVLFAILLFGAIQSLFSYIVFGDFSIPYSGFIDIIKEKDIIKRYYLFLINNDNKINLY